MKIKKKLIYLDQNIFSIISKESLSVAEQASTVKRLEELTNKQLIICPYSDTHDKETHLIAKNENSEKLFMSIRNASRGKRFNSPEKIKEQQMINAYQAFLSKKPSSYELNLSDAIGSNVHDWDNSRRGGVEYSITDFSPPYVFRQEKEKIKRDLLNVIPKWRDSTSSLEEDFNLEINAYIRILKDALEKVVRGVLHENHHYNLMFTTLLELEPIASDSERNIRDFLDSEYFIKIPYVNISAGLWAMLKQEIKKKQFLSKATSEDSLKKEVQGLHFDIEHLSVFTPYCDSVLTEDRMARHLNAWNRHVWGVHSTKAFSIKHLDEFNSYLDEIEKEISPKMQKELEIVLGG